MRSRRYPLPYSSALVTLLAYNGLRIDEALSADIGDYSYQRSHRGLGAHGATCRRAQGLSRVTADCLAG